MMMAGFYEIRKHIDDLIVPIEIMFYSSKMPCFVKGDIVFENIRERLSTKNNTGVTSDNEYQEFVDRLV
jgi:hypothetical protein